MSVSDRKISFYSIKVTKTDQSPNNPSPLSKAIKNVNRLPKTIGARQLNVKQSNKLHLLDIVEETSSDRLFLIFKTAKYNHCPPLLNTQTLQERASNKTPNEGESEKTHIAIKFDTDEAIMILEERQAGIPLRCVLQIFEALLLHAKQTNILKNLYKVDYAIIPGNNFLTELNNLTAAKIGEVYITKQALGSSQLNFSNHITQVQDDLILTIKAKRKLSVKQAMRDVYNNITSSGSIITKLRIHGLDSDNKKVILDTEFIKKIEYLNVSLDAITKVVDSGSVKLSMDKILSNM